MGRKLFAVVLVWALVATGFAVVKNKELQDLSKKLTEYEKYASANDSKVKDLQTRITLLKSNLNSYKKQYEELLKDYYALKRQMNKQNETISKLKKKLEIYMRVPYDYYFCRVFPRHNNTLKEMKAFLSNLTIPKGLNGTKLQAFLEWALKCAGFDAHIAYGEIENEATGNESMGTWLVVFLKDGVYNIVNTDKGLKIFNASEELELEVHGKEVELEYEPAMIFRDIYSVMEYLGKPEMWNWWNVTGFPPKI